MVFQVVVSTIFYFHPYLAKIPILTSIFFRWVDSTTNQFSSSQLSEAKTHLFYLQNAPANAPMPGPTLVDGSWKEAYCYGFSVYFGMKTWDFFRNSQGLQGTPDDFCFPNRTPIRIPKEYGNSMGPAYHKGVPCPWESLESPLIRYARGKQPHYD